jgi:hypothetical protein
MLTQWVVMVLNCNVLCHLQQCKCPDQDLWAPLYMIFVVQRGDHAMLAMTQLPHHVRIAKIRYPLGKHYSWLRSPLSVLRPGTADGLSSRI